MFDLIFRLLNYIADEKPKLIKFSKPVRFNHDFAATTEFKNNITTFIIPVFHSFF